MSIYFIPAVHEDYHFMEDLAVENMIGYYNRHGLVFSRAIFELDCKKSNNWLIIENGDPIGFIRVEFTEDNVHISDIQIKESHRNRGIGTDVLKSIHVWTKHLRGSTLNVFVTNPAIELYWRLGYRWKDSDEEGPILTMYRTNP